MSDELQSARHPTVRQQIALQKLVAALGDASDEDANTEAINAAYWEAHESLYSDAAPEPWEIQKRAADRLAAAVDVMIQRRFISARSWAGDARLDYGEPMKLEDALALLHGRDACTCVLTNPKHPDNAACVIHGDGA